MTGTRRGTITGRLKVPTILELHPVFAVTKRLRRGPMVIGIGGGMVVDAIMRTLMRPDLGYWRLPIGAASWPW